MSITIRALEARDYPAILEVYNRAAPPGIQPPETDVPESHRYVAVDPETRRVVGFAIVPLKEWHSFDLVVSPDRQRQGVGSLLWERIAQDMAQTGASAVEPWVREENVPAIGWLTKHGFTPTKLDGPVCLFPDSANSFGFDNLDIELGRQGVELSTLAREQLQDKDCLPKLHALYNKVKADVPDTDDYVEQTLEEFISEQEEPEAMPGAYFIAKQGSEYIGLSYLRPRAADPNCIEPNIVQQCLTGVLPEYRRRGIATALKVKTISYAREHGFRRIFTNSDNPAMKVLNAKLGFVSGPWRVYRKNLR